MTSPLTDEHGFVRGFPYHDGFLDGVLVDGREARFALRDLEGTRRVFSLRDIRCLCMDEFRQGNIVADLRVISVVQARENPTVCKLLADRLYLDPMTLDPSLRIFSLECSYGAEVIAVCGEVDISEAGVTLTR